MKVVKEKQRHSQTRCIHTSNPVSEGKNPRRLAIFIYKKDLLGVRDVIRTNGINFNSAAFKGKYTGLKVVNGLKWVLKPTAVLSCDEFDDSHWLLLRVQDYNSASQPLSQNYQAISN